jgi:dTDP-4-amino-4,6-dideoxygalactose transaminase
MIATSDDALMSRIQRLRQYGWSHKYFQQDVGGRNSRLDEIHAGFLCVGLRFLGDRNRRRVEIASRYAAAGWPLTQAEFAEEERHVYHLAVASVHDRDRVIAELGKLGIQSGIHYPYLDSDLPALAVYRGQSGLPNAQKSKNKILSLPCFPELTALEIDRVCEAASIIRLG